MVRVYKKIRIPDPTYAKRRRRQIYRRRAAAIKGRIVVSEKFSSETTPAIMGNSGYALSTKINEMPQYPVYSQLYRKFRVLNITYILVPTYNSASFPDFGTPIPPLSRIVYAIQDTPSGNAPASEAEVLEDNGCKIRTSPGQIIKIKHYPKPDLSTDGAGLTTPMFSFQQRTPLYLNTRNSENAAGSAADAVEFSGVNLWCSATGGVVYYSVFTKMVVEFSDPA